MARIAATAILPASLVVVPPAIATVQHAIPRPSSAVAIVEVSLADRTLTLSAGDEILGSWPVVTGDAAHPSPTGSFQIRRIVWNPDEAPSEQNDTTSTSKKSQRIDDTAGNVKIYFHEPAYYIHAANDDAPIGRTASHGCIRMRVDDAIALATLVMEHGGEPRSPNWFRRVLNRVTQTREIRLSTPVRILIS